MESAASIAGQLFEATDTSLVYRDNGSSWDTWASVGLVDPLTTRGANEITMVSEFGVVLAGVAVVVCIPFWVMGARISRDTAVAQSG